MTKRKLKFFANFDKEEAWLNRMAAQGHLLTKAGMLYKFAPVTPGNAVVRVDYRPSMSQPDFEDYIGLFDDAGWQHLDGSRHGGTQYFASFSDDANADIFSDTSSKAQRYRRSIATHGALLVPLLAVVIALDLFDTLTSPHEWYLTPGLWEMQGGEFLAAFLFETAFVVLRIGGPLLLVGFCLYSTAWITYQSVLYHRTITRQEARPAQ